MTEEDKELLTIGTKIRSKANPDEILIIIYNDCHGDEFECSNGYVLSLKQIEKYYDYHNINNINEKIWRNVYALKRMFLKMPSLANLIKQGKVVRRYF